MKKTISNILLSFVLVSQMQIMQVYAQDVAELVSDKNTGVQALDAVEQVIGQAVEALDDQIVDTKQSEKLEKKHEEIDEYLKKVQKEINEVDSSEDIKEKVEKAKKVVVLKVVSGVTQYEDVADTISNDIATTPAEKQNALESIQDSLVGENNDYSLIIKTSYSKNKVEKTFNKFDDDTIVELMYKAGGEKYFEIFLKKDSIFRKEMLEDIESGILPVNFISMEIVKPEVYTLEGVKSAEKVQKNLLKGEDLSQLWGIESYLHILNIYFNSQLNLSFNSS